MTGLLEGKRLVVTGVVNHRSIAYAIAERAQREGAELVLTSFGRVRRMTERAAKRLPEPPDVLELDVNDDGDLAALTRELAGRWGRVDGAVHAIAYAPPDALGGEFLATPRESAGVAFETSAYSLKALAQALAPMMAHTNGGAPRAGSIVGLDFDASVAWPAYDWMGVAKAALESVSRYLARDLGPAGVRVNLVSAGPVATPAASGIPGFGQLARSWSAGAPLGWDSSDGSAVADAALFLLSDLSRAITGEILHVDGGFHALGAVVPEPAASTPT
ncbi:MAG TPA: enoyl-ACP reductase FabI [Solirubrobacterales bacterium]|nr:enoyl-ACP reductase FabI [Solirubrobacterales bacterium]